MSCEKNERNHKTAQLYQIEKTTYILLPLFKPL